MSSVVHQGIHLSLQKQVHFCNISIALSIKTNWQFYGFINFFLGQRCRLDKFFILYTSDPALSHCSRNPGICRAMPVYLFPSIAVHSRDCSLEPQSPREWWVRQVCTAASKRNWAHIHCMIHEVDICLELAPVSESLVFWRIYRKRIDDIKENNSPLKSLRNLTKFINY